MLFIYAAFPLMPPKACRASKRLVFVRLERNAFLQRSQSSNTDYGYTQSLIHEKHEEWFVVVVVVVVSDGVGRGVE